MLPILKTLDDGVKDLLETVNIFSLQEVWTEMQRLWRGDQPSGPGEESQRQGVPSQVFHMLRVSQAAVDRGGTLCGGRHKVCLQGGLQ